MRILGNGIYSKQIPDVIYAYAKEDPMGNGQLKPGYNLQIGNRKPVYARFWTLPSTDTLTLIPFENHEHCNRFPLNVTTV